MHVLEVGTQAPEFTFTDLDGNSVSLSGALAGLPAVVVFCHPSINASRLVIGYLRRLPEINPNVKVLVLSEGTPEETTRYARPSGPEGTYLTFPVGVDACQVAKLYRVTHLPTTYLIGADGKILSAYTGFGKFFLNTLGNTVAELTGAKAKDLIADGDNKGFYELAERGPCA
ncbi:MAG TPA: redoxin domain-containing protein [Deinococcales bacterium]|nr:redoxin domain-containing protein [Deinococcales bacterium]